MFPLAICDVVTSLIVIALIKFFVGAVIGVPAVDTVRICPPALTDATWMLPLKLTDATVIVASLLPDAIVIVSPTV